MSGERAPIPDHGQHRASATWRHGKLALVAVTLAFYLPTLATEATFNDAPEITTAIYTLGVIHPTGYPLFTMVAHLFVKLVPWLEPVLRVSLFNALCGAVAAVLTAAAVRQVADTIRLGSHLQGGRSPASGYRREVEVAALVAGLLLALSPLYWNQVRIAEVYAFHVALVSWAGYCWLRFGVTRRARYALMAAFAMGCGLAHHVTMVYMVPAGALLLLLTTPKAWKTWLGCTFAGGVPLTSYGYLIWANEHTSGLPWGGVHDWQSLYNHVSGVQYRRFLGSGTWRDYLARLAKVPDFFDQNLLPVGTLLFALGVAAVVRRQRRLGTFLLLYIALNVGHGVVYRVGDYGNYYLPALWSCCVLVGVGGWWLGRWARETDVAARRWLAQALVALTVLTAGIMIAGYSRFSNRMPEWLSKRGYLIVAAALVAVAATLFYHAVQRRSLRLPPLGPRVLPATVLGCVLGLVAPAAVARAQQIGGLNKVGGNYGEELATRLPRGAVLMVLGDGYLFNIWYQQHVMGRGMDVGCVDIGNVRTPWYSDYLRSRNPLPCDPLAESNLRDPLRYQRECSSYRARVDKRERRSWIVFPNRQNPTRRGAIPGLQAPVLRGNDPRCADPKFLGAHRHEECGCWRAGKESGPIEEYCVHSFDEGGYVPVSSWEVLINRMIEDHIDTRPVFEANVLTFVENDAKKNPRQWRGPRHQRPSADYAVLNRGRANQIVYREDIEGFDPCASDTLVELPLRPLWTIKPYSRHRRLYRPNRHPTLFKTTYLSGEEHGNSDTGRREYRRGESVYFLPGWFEEHYQDKKKKDGKGKPIRHGVRLCVYGPDGRRVKSWETLSGTRHGFPIALKTGAGSPAGRYRLRACSVGEMGQKKPPFDPGLACSPVILDYAFTVE